MVLLSFLKKKKLGYYLKWTTVTSFHSLPKISFSVTVDPNGCTAHGMHLTKHCKLNKTTNQ